MKKTMLRIVQLSLFFLLALTSCVEKDYIENPKVGDVYLVECLNVVPDSPIAYNLIKVKAISGDSLQVIPNCAYYHDKIYCLTALDYFNSQAAYYLTKEKVIQMYDKGEIVDVMRLYEDACLGHDK